MTVGCWKSLHQERLTLLHLCEVEVAVEGMHQAEEATTAPGHDQTGSKVAQNHEVANKAVLDVPHSAFMTASPGTL